jgi:cytoplasmic FMR1 interacting protein
VHILLEEMTHINKQTSLRARCPLEDKVACAIKQSDAPLHRVKFGNTISAFETLPQRTS